MMRSALTTFAALLVAAQAVAQTLPVQSAPVQTAPARTAPPPGLSAADRRAGAASHPQLVAQFGGEYKGRQAAYVRDVGRRIALQSGLATRPEDYTVTLLNSNVNNAFAVPGGYVYVTRQLVALMNDEAELAFVLGHEIGHVAGRHAEKRNQRSVIAGVGAALFGVLTGSSLLGDLAGTGAQIYSLSYSRDQEREADSLGIRYLARAGYDPDASGDILSELGAQTALEARLAGKSDREPTGWLSTHPANAERVARIRKEAAALANVTGRATNRDGFLDAIDGMAYDDDPAEGIVTGTQFRHTGLGLAFDAPPGFAVQNSSNAVTGSKAGAGRFSFAGGRVNGAGLDAYARSVWQGIGVRPPDMRAQAINGNPALIGQTRVQQAGRSIDAAVVAYQWGPDSFYHLVMLAPANGLPTFKPLIESVRRLSPAESVGSRGRRVKVVRVQAGDTVESLAAQMAYADNRVARFTILNGITPQSRLVPGSRVKLIVAS
jgi:predicted Zn-dependent protease